MIYKKISISPTEFLKRYRWEWIKNNGKWDSKKFYKDYRKLEKPYIVNSLTGNSYTREKVRARDNYTCQMCRKIWKEGSIRFDVHHLNGLCGKKSHGYDRLKDIDTLITLCHKCHFNHPEHSRVLKRGKH